MKKFLFTVLTIILCVSLLSSCNGVEENNNLQLENMIVVKSGKVHINKPENLPEIICTYNPSSFNSEKIKIEIEDTSFFEELVYVIEGKTVENKPCNCSGDYQILIGNNYNISLHHKKSILIYSETKEISSFTIDCSETEMQELYDYLEKQTKK